MSLEINEITQNISPVTALPGLLEPERPAAVNVLVEQELPLLSTEVETLVGQLNDFKDEANALSAEVEANKNLAEASATLANGLANFKGAWSGATTYAKGQSVESTAGSKIYYTSKLDGNLNNIVTNTTYWLLNPINDKLDKDTAVLTDKTSLVDADVVLMGDSASSSTAKKITWTNFKASIGTALGAIISSLTAKTTPVDADGFVIKDSAASNASKFLSLANLKATIFASPTLTGNPTAPTQTAQNNSTRLATTAYVDGKFIRGTAVATTSGTAIDFTSIPSWAKEIVIILNGVSTNGTSGLLLQVGSGSIQNSGYSSQSWTATGSGIISNGFGLTGTVGASTVELTGIITIENITLNTWIESGSIGVTNSTSNGIASIGKSPNLSGALDRLRLTSINGTDTFDAGSVNIMYRG